MKKKDLLERILIVCNISNFIGFLEIIIDSVAVRFVLKSSVSYFFFKKKS